jgi:hypothetical protein
MPAVDGPEFRCHAAMISTMKCFLRLLNAVASGAILVPAPWKWWKAMTESGDVRVAPASATAEIMSRVRLANHRVSRA